MAGDYYRGGGYYKAGGLGSIFGGIKKIVGGAVKGFTLGGPVGGLIGAGAGTVAAVKGRTAEATLAAGGSGSALTPVMRARHAAVVARGAGIGKPAAGLAAIPAVSGGGFYGGRRTMNTLNPKALSRATRRIKGFEKHAKRSLSALGLHVVRNLPKKARFGGRR